MQWFKHDSNANTDDKLQQVLLDYGLEGYGLYWYCLELIVNRVDKDNITFELKHDSRVIARNTGSTPQKVEEMMRRFIELGLFESDSGMITCLKLIKRMDSSMTSNPYMREIITKAKYSHDAVMTQSAIVMQEEKRREEKRRDKINNIVDINIDQCPHQEIIAIYKDVLPNGIQPLTWNGVRRSNLKARWREDVKRQNLDWWKGLFEYIKKSDFLMGKTYSKDKRPFEISLDKIVRPEMFNKIIEGQYHG